MVHSSLEPRVLPVRVLYSLSWWGCLGQEKNMVVANTVGRRSVVTLKPTCWSGARMNDNRYILSLCACSTGPRGKGPCRKDA